MALLRNKLTWIVLPGWLPQALKFLAVGVLNTLVDAAVYLALTRWVPVFALYPAIAKALSYSAGVINSFYWNKRWTFRSPARAAATFPPFVLVNLIGVALNAVTMQLCLQELQLPELVSFALATAATLAWNFAASKYLVFREPKPETD